MDKFLNVKVNIIINFMQLNKFDVNIVDVPWGNTPRDYFTNNQLTKREKEMKKIIVPDGTVIDYLPDFYVDIRIPNEFELRGKVNIGITAGVETTTVSQNWLEKVNEMHMTIVPSEHSKAGFTNTIYDKMNNLPDGKQQKIGELKLKTGSGRGEVEVLFEGADEDIYKPLTKDEIDTEFFDWLNDEVPEKHAFLFVGQWCKGNFGEDRKDIGRTIKLFYETFANRKGKKPALILKTSGATFSIMDREDCLRKINEIKSQFPKDFDLPNVYLLHGDMSQTELNYLYNHPKCKAMVSFTHGEGFGRPLLEASMTGLPIIVSSWSGHLDFLNPQNCILLPGKLNKVPPGAVWEDIVIPESQWFTVDEKQAYNYLKSTFENIEDVKTKGKKLMEENRSKFTLDKMTEELDRIMEKHLKDVPQQVGLKLPKLKSFSSSTKEKKPIVKLPKLKKELVNG